MKRVLIDASSAILLHKARIFQDMAEHYVLNMVPTVFDEITVANHSGAEIFKEAKDSGQIQLVVPDRDTIRDKITASLHAGEFETIMAYADEPAHFVIMDDGRGARACRTMGIPYINALLCPSILYLSGKIDGMVRESAFTTLKTIGRYSGEIVAYAEMADLENLSSFFP